LDENQKIINLKRKINNDEFRQQQRKVKEENKRKKFEAPIPRKRKFNFVNFVFIIFVLYFAYTAFNQYKVIQYLDTQIEEKNLIQAKAMDTAESLKKDVEKINDNDALMELVEKVARNQYKMVKPNEIIYIDKNRNDNKLIMGIGSGNEITNSDSTDVQ
jgi:cell division protein FtsB